MAIAAWASTERAIKINYITPMFLVFFLEGFAPLWHIKSDKPLPATVVPRDAASVAAALFESFSRPLQISKALPICEKVSILIIGVSINTTFVAGTGSHQVLSGPFLRKV